MNQTRKATLRRLIEILEQQIGLIEPDYDLIDRTIKQIKELLK